MEKSVYTSELVELQDAFDQRNGVSESKPLGNFNDEEEYQEALLDFQNGYIFGEGNEKWETVSDYLASLDK
jgi:hypothetical protein